MEAVFTISLKKAAKENGLEELSRQCEKIVPDIENQYSTFTVDSEFRNIKARNQHAFQISFVGEIIEEFENPTIVDIGDSAGTHLQYIKGLYSSKKDIKCLSVNLDGGAVKRIKKKGFDAILAKAEDLSNYNIMADIFICFQTLEHLMNPCEFLHQLSQKSDAKYLIITVPYNKCSRVGLHHIRNEQETNVFAENTHIFELNLEDWKLVFKHCGWDILKEKIYRQYPMSGFLAITKYFWRKFDFEGFYGVILKKDDRWSSRYMDW